MRKRFFDLGFCLARLTWKEELSPNPYDFELIIISPRDEIIPAESITIYDRDGEKLREFIKELDDILNKNGKK